jgi:predicted transcriptional regulator
MVNGDPGRLVELAGPLVGMIVMPYLGSAAARAELERPVPRGASRGRVASVNPLKDLEMRLTYRTVRVLGAVAAHPGSSNRGVGEASGMRDQGQTSKLLARLERLGLIENTDAGSAQGGPNAWSLTHRGLEVHGVLTAQAHS